MEFFLCPVCLCAIFVELFLQVFFSWFCSGGIFVTSLFGLRTIFSRLVTDVERTCRCIGTFMVWTISSWFAQFTLTACRLSGGFSRKSHELTPTDGHWVHQRMYCISSKIMPIWVKYPDFRESYFQSSVKNWTLISPNMTLLLLLEAVTLHHGYMLSPPGAFDLWLLPQSLWLRRGAEGVVVVVDGGRSAWLVQRCWTPTSQHVRGMADRPLKVVCWAQWPCRQRVQERAEEKDENRRGGGGHSIMDGGTKGM